MWNDDIKFRVIQPNDYEQVIDFVVENFYRDEPLSRIEPKVVPGESDRADILACLQGGTSILAVQIKENGDEELVAVNTAVVKDSSCIDKYFETAEREGSTKYGQIMKLLGIASREADVFQKYGVQKILYSFMSCVKPTLRGKNIGVRIKLELMDMGRRMGYKLITADCTSYYSARVCERLDWDRVNFLAYKDYVDENNEPIFKPPPPHEGLTSFAKRL